MMQMLEILCYAFALALAVPVVVLAAECLLAALPDPRHTESSSAPPVAVIVPAHNEEETIRPTLEALLAQLRSCDLLLVIADNCDDDTAAVARSAGATVIERCDGARRGKGFALQFAVEHLRTDPRPVVAIVDADCHVQEGSIPALAAEVESSSAPVQGLDLLYPPPGAGLRSRISALAFAVKNHARPAGLRRIGLPCLLMGTGMAFPWPVLEQANLASDSLVEDVQLGVDLAIAGHPARFCTNSKVSGELPADGLTSLGQRRRWEHGTLRTMFTQVPRLAWAGLRRRRLDLLALALDLSVPPLALLVIAWALSMTLAVMTALLGGSAAPAVVLGATGALLAASVLLAYLCYGRHLLPAWMLLAVPLYAIWKLPLYAAFIFRRQKEWVRTKRETPAGPSASLP